MTRLSPRPGGSDDAAAGGYLSSHWGLQAIQRGRSGVIDVRNGPSVPLILMALRHMRTLLGLTVWKLQPHVHNHMHACSALGYRKTAYSKLGRRRHKRMRRTYSTPGRTRTDTGDPFRGPASSLGLRGCLHNTAGVFT
jgi:hypothetical protein